jgi:hypothetical protein
MLLRPVSLPKNCPLPIKDAGTAAWPLAGRAQSCGSWVPDLRSPGSGPGSLVRDTPFSRPRRVQRALCASGTRPGIQHEPAIQCRLIPGRPGRPRQARNEPRAPALLEELLPQWLIIATGSVLVLFSAFCFGAAVWRHLYPGVPPPRIDVSRIPPWMLIAVNGFLALVALAALVGIWFGRDIPSG